MDELAAARIRLEGALEVLERTTVTLQSATAALGRHDVSEASSAAQLLEAEGTRDARRKAGLLALPSVESVVDGLARAERRFRTQLLLRGRSLRLESDSLTELAARLEAEPPLLEERQRRWWGVGLSAAVWTAVVVPLALGVDSWDGAWVQLGCIALFTGLCVAFGVRSIETTEVVVTRRRLVVGADEVEFSSYGTRCVVREVTETGDGEQVKVRLDVADGPLGTSRSIPLTRFWSGNLRQALQQCDHPPLEVGFGARD